MRSNRISRIYKLSARWLQCWLLGLPDLRKSVNTIIFTQYWLIYINNILKTCMCSLLHSLLRAHYTGIARYILSPRGNWTPETRNRTQRRHVTSRGQNQMSTQPCGSRPPYRVGRTLDMTWTVYGRRRGQVLVAGDDVSRKHDRRSFVPSWLESRRDTG